MLTLILQKQNPYRRKLGLYEEIIQDALKPSALRDILDEAIKEVDTEEWTISRTGQGVSAAAKPITPDAAAKPARKAAAKTARKAAANATPAVDKTARKGAAKPTTPDAAAKPARKAAAKTARKAAAKPATPAADKTVRKGAAKPTTPVNAKPRARKNAPVKKRYRINSINTKL